VHIMKHPNCLGNFTKSNNQTCYSFCQKNNVYKLLMKNTFLNRALGLLLLIVSFSCSSDLDFNQANDIKLEPVYVSNLAYFDIPANEFVTNGIEQNVFFDAPTVTIFNDTFFNDNLKRADFSFEINNTINRAYTIDITLLNNVNAPLYTMNFDVPAYSGVQNLVTKTEIFENTKLDLLKNTTKIAFVLRMLPGPILSESSLGSIKLRSSVTAYLVVE
jgi:hypothetical protein